MADEIRARYLPNRNLWASVYAADGTVWTGSAFADPRTVRLTDSALVLAPTELDPKTYAADFPSGITTPSTYTVVLHEQMGPTPADTDVEIAAGELEWDGSQESPPPSDNPNVAWCTCTTTARRPDLAVVAGAAFEFLPVDLTPAASLAFGDRPKSTTSAGDGSVQVSLPRTATFRYRWGRGPWIKFIVPDAGSYGLPPVTDGA